MSVDNETSIDEYLQLHFDTLKHFRFESYWNETNVFDFVDF